MLPTTAATMDVAMTPTVGPGAGATTTGSTPPPTTGAKEITIGSKDFTEQFILAELYAQALEANGYTVTRKLNLGGVALADQALTSGQIHMYPEYTGTALEALVKYSEDELPSPEETYELVQEFYAERQPSMTLLEPAGFENTYGIFVTKAIADQYNLTSLSDLERESANLRFASFGEFQNRQDGLPNIKAAGNYPGVNFKQMVLVNDLGLRYRAIQDGRADVGIGFTTDPQLLDPNLVVLEDPKQIWPPYYPVPVINTEYLQAHPDVEGILNEVSAQLSSPDVMRELLRQAVEDEEEPVDIASAFLQEKGLK